MAPKSQKPEAASWPILGHGALGRHLVAALTSGTLPKAMLFRGPSHVGKATAARWMVQRSLCTSSAAHRPCVQCAACRQVAAGQSPNALIIDGAAETISVEQVRDTLATFHTSAWGDRDRWLLILDAETLTEAASNALLKFLEELPGQTRVILTTSQPDRLLATIRSRVTEYAFHFVPLEALKNSVTETALVQRAAGRPGWLHVLKTSNTWSEDQQRATDTLERLHTGQTLSVKSLTQQGIEPVNALEFEELVWRDALLNALGVTTRRLWSKLTPSTFTPQRIAATLERYLDRYELSPSIQSRLVYDDLHLV